MTHQTEIKGLPTKSTEFSKKAEAFINKLEALELPNSQVKHLGMVGYGCTDIEEYNSEEYTPTLRVVFESSFGEDSRIINELWMPEKWNGELIGQGNGGYGGTLTSKHWKHIGRGFCAVETDMGTSRFVKEDFPKFSYNVLKDYSWRSTHVMTVVAKILIEAFYGKAPTRSFFVGASAGGLQGYSEAQRFPEDYDGILVGVPSNNALNYHVYNIWLFQKLIRPDGNPHFHSRNTERINECAVEFFRAHGDGIDGDNFISFPYIDENTVDNFISYLKEKIPEFSEEQLNALRDVYNGPVHSKTGEQIFSGLPIGAEIFCNYMVKDISYTRCGNKWFDPYFETPDKSQSLEFAEDYEELVTNLDLHLGAHNPNLSEFKKRGGKLLSYSGAADRSGPFGDMLKYYNRVCDRLGGYGNVSDFYRHFTLPGKAHGNNGRGTNVTWGNEDKLPLIDTLRQWHSDGKAPDYLVCAHEMENDDKSVSYKFIRRVYPYRNDMTEGKDFPKSTAERLLDIPQYKEDI